MKWLGPLVLGFLLSFFAGTVAHSHSWYGGTKNPATGQSCCGKSDCFAVSLESLTETRDEWVVVINERFRPTDYAPVIPAGVYKFNKKDALPAAGPPKKGESGYYACIVATKPRCFFFSSGS